ncbi:hypothetical protein [Dongia deserti]|uniref:hypothetical protein n=1 Tax=Dongia deserti TaxID=2268030 RepID=UPI0013C49C5A|nr:hypothetical protein [Dongia deserti]
MTFMRAFMGFATGSSNRAWAGAGSHDNSAIANAYRAHNDSIVVGRAVNTAAGCDS